VKGPERVLPKNSIVKIVGSRVAGVSGSTVARLYGFDAVVTTLPSS
jgi:hypothetical protein